MRLLEARPGEPEVIKPVIQRDAGDADAEIGHVGEVRQSHPAGLVDLPEDDLLLRAMNGAPGADAALHRAPDAGVEIGMTPPHLLKNADRSQARC